MSNHSFSCEICLAILLQSSAALPWHNGVLKPKRDERLKCKSKSNEGSKRTRLRLFFCKKQTWTSLIWRQLVTQRVQRVQSYHVIRFNVRTTYLCYLRSLFKIRHVQIDELPRTFFLFMLVKKRGIETSFHLLTLAMLVFYKNWNKSQRKYPIVCIAHAWWDAALYLHLHT